MDLLGAATTRRVRELLPSLLALGAGPGSRRRRGSTRSRNVDSSSAMAMALRPMHVALLPIDLGVVLLQPRQAKHDGVRGFDHIEAHQTPVPIPKHHLHGMCLVRDHARRDVAAVGDLHVRWGQLRHHRQTQLLHCLLIDEARRRSRVQQRDHVMLPMVAPYGHWDRERPHGG